MSTIRCNPLSPALFLTRLPKLLLLRLTCAIADWVHDNGLVSAPWAGHLYH